MNQFSRYYVRLIQTVWEHIVFFFKDILWEGIIARFFINILEYWDVLMSESADFTVVSWVMVVLAAFINISLIIFILIRFFLWLRRYVTFRG